MPTETLPPARAARQIGVPPNTLRAWCKVYREFLSEGANPGGGVERRLTPGDVETLRAVAQLRTNDIPPEDILNRLRENPNTSTEGLPRPPESSTIDSGGVAGENTQLAPLQSIVAVSVGKVDAMADKLEAVDRRLERVESQRSMILVAVAAFAAGAVVVATVVWLVWLLSLMR